MDSVGIQQLQQQKQEQKQAQIHTFALQRQHIEVAIISVSAIRLCTALLHDGSLLAAATTGVTYLVALLLEFGPVQLDSPYHLRRSASHGVAQGVLSVPSVLAALVAAAPTGGWQPWLLGSCSAAMATCCVIHHQSVHSSAVHPAAVHPAAPQAGVNRGVSKQNRPQPRVVTANTTIPEPFKPSGSSSTSGTILAFLVLVCAALVASHHQEQFWPNALQDIQQQLLLLLQGSLVAELAAAAVKLLMWGCIAAASFCLSLQLLPGCFSLGEAALLAHGATCLIATAAGALQRATQFVPAAVCAQLPPELLLSVQRTGACTAEAHRTALSLEGLTAAISLVLAAAVAACLLLRVLLTAVQQLRQHFVSSSSRGTNIKAVEQHVHGANSTFSSMPSGATAAAGESTPNGTCRPTSASRSSSSRSSSRSRSRSQGPVVVVATLVSALAAAAGICVLLLWLCCAAAWTLLEFLPAVPGRLGVLLYWVGLLAATLPALKWLARVSGMPQIIVRKVYHLLAMGLFVPVFFWDLQLLALSLAIAFAALVLCELLRCTHSPLLGQAVQSFMQAFVDERDTGVIYITHFTLLLGLAVPMWLCLVMPGAQGLVQTHSLVTTQHAAQQAYASGSFAAAAGAQQQGCPSGGFSCGLADTSSAGAAFKRLLAAYSWLWKGSRDGWSDGQPSLLQVTAGLSGVVIIGVGDTAASFVGKLFGRVPVHAGSSKTVEGTLAGISASLGSWLVLLWAVRLLPGLSTAYGIAWWVQLIGATAGAGLMEAATSQLDNILLPLWYLPHLLLV